MGNGTDHHTQKNSPVSANLGVGDPGAKNWDDVRQEGEKCAYSRRRLQTEVPE